jgi:hypothetical protein
MKLRWGRTGYLASVIFPIFEHVHDITDLPTGTGGDDRHDAISLFGQLDELLARQVEELGNATRQRLE